MRDERQLASHFAFGENWLSFQSGVAEAEIAEAERGLAKLLLREEVAGRGFLDVGCGSGLSMLAALRLGAREVIGVDIDPASVRAARALLGRHAPGGSWRVEEASALDLSPEAHGRHEVVHSWGVLHHTGAMWDAVDRVCRLVAPGGRLALALYGRTPFCPLWAVEKRLYARAHPAVQAAIRGPFKAALLLRVAAGGRDAIAYVRGYRTRRGMDWAHDVQDWLGGYPYESVRPAELRAFLAYHDAVMERESGLSKAEREMVVVATSAARSCTYCVVAHGAILRVRAKDPLISDFVATDVRHAPVTPRQAALLAYAVQLSVEPETVVDADLDALRAHGLSDDDIWDVGAVTAFFAMSNRLAHAMALVPNEEFHLMGRLPRNGRTAG